MTPLLGHSNIFQAESKVWLWLVLPFLPFVFFSSFSVLLLRDTEQVNRARHTTLHIRERFFFSPFRRSRPLVLFVSFVFISLTATFRLGKLAI